MYTFYQALHLAMGYDGIKNYKICQAGMEDAKRIIDWCEKNQILDNVSVTV